MKVRKIYLALSLIFVVTLGAFVSLSSQPTRAQDANYIWESVSGAPTNVDFTSIFMLNERSGLIAGHQGDAGIIYEALWQGEGTNRKLQLTPAGTFRAPLLAVVTTGPDVYAVGEHGLIVHRDASGWHEMPNPVPDATLLTLQMLGNGSEGWAAGYRSTPEPTGSKEAVLLHYINGSWQRDDSIKGPFAINSLHFAPGSGWAAGSSGIWRYRNGAWAPEQQPEPCGQPGCYPYYSGVRALSEDEAWIVGDYAATCGICTSQPYIIHRTGGRWVRDVPGNPIVANPITPPSGYDLRGVTFSDNANGIAVGTVTTGSGSHPLVLMYRQGKWIYATTRASIGVLNSVSALDNGHAVAVGDKGAILSYGYGPQTLPTITPTYTTTPMPTALATYVAGLTATAVATPQTGSNPTQRVSDPHDPNVTYFPLVGHTLRGTFRTYWQAHGGLPQFGYPLTEEYREVSPTDGKTYTVQYFERNRFEYHPENKPPYDVLLGLLGHTITQGRENEQPFQPVQPNPAKGGALYFPETHHFMDPVFTAYWQSHGGLPVYGYPISGPVREQSPTDGKIYLVQYFERNRFEYHPELSAEFRVSLGLLGVEVLRDRGWIP